jgi:ubiquinone/menaquinone biosynthesis C-methylase UbiE
MSALRDRGVDVHLESAPQQLEYELIARRLVADRPAKLLDWGAGLGHMTIRLTKLGLDVTAIDYRDEYPAPTVEPIGLAPELEMHLTPEPVALPFDDDSFDAVLSCGVLEHVADPGGSLDEIKRVLRPGGTVYIYKLPNRHSYLEWIAKRIGLYYHGKLPHDAVYTEREAVDLVRRHGFAVEEARLANMLPLTLPGTAARRGAKAIFELGRLLARVPGLRRLATNIEIIATAPR